MQYMLLNYTAPGRYRDAAEIRAAAGADDVWGAYTRALIDAGILVSGNALHPVDAATTVRMGGGGAEIEDGPYATTKEHLGGYYVIDVPDLDTALAWAARNPAAADGAVEVRPVVDLRAG